MRYSRLSVVAAAILPLQTATLRAEAPMVADVEVAGTAFVVRLTDGTVLEQQKLAGAVLEVNDDKNASFIVRIDNVIPDPRDPGGEVVLYRLEVQGNDGSWQEFCRPDPDGERWAFPLAGSWTTSGEHRKEEGGFIVTCSSGAIGKCVRFGYKPWASGPDGQSMWKLHQACVRMIRADYCGNGNPHTRDGIRIEFHDRFGIQRPEPAEYMSFEAAWAADGTVCVAHTRVRDLAKLDDLARVCPERLAGHLGPSCEMDAPDVRSNAMFFNKSVIQK